MRYLLVLLVLVMSLSNVEAQTFTPSVKTSTSTLVVGSVTIAGKTFKGGESKTGSIYIMRTSKKSGEEYKSYIGTPLGKTYEGHQIYWANKDGEKVYFYFTINETTGYPKRNYLDAN